jgi:hypothetical protein
MKISDIDSSIDIVDFENFFKIHKDNNGYYKYNLNENLYINVEPENCEQYILKTRAYWPLISYKIYNTTKLAWLLMKINDVKGENIFEYKNPGDIIYYLPRETVEQIVNTL